MMLYCDQLDALPLEKNDDINQHSVYLENTFSKFN
jgi:hypothetical protein